MVSGIVLHCMGECQFPSPSLEFKSKKPYVRCLFSIKSPDNELLSTQNLTAVTLDLLICLPRYYFFL